MNPDKFFDYLDGKLSAPERAKFEEQLLNDAELQRELAMARKIHSRMGGDSREVVLEDETAISERGRKLARRIGMAFIVLVAVNVGAGLWFIWRHEAANPNRKLLEAQMREQLRKSAEHAAGVALPTPSLQADEVRISVTSGQTEAAAREVIEFAEAFGGSGTKGLLDKDGLLVFIEVPARKVEAVLERLSRFGSIPPESRPEPATDGKTKISVRILEGAKP